MIDIDPIIRKANSEDIPAVAEIYSLIHQKEARGEVAIGWNPKTYPIRETAEKALLDNTLFVMTIDDEVVASAVINHIQLDAYSLPQWKYPVPPDKVGVIHTLVVNPNYTGRGLGKLFVAFFENYCRLEGCEVVRLDTQEKNIGPLNMYPKLGYHLAGIFNTTFQDLPSEIRLALFEKKL